MWHACECAKSVPMKKKILLINPWIYDFAAYDLWINPIGLLYIASILRRNGYEIQFLDCLNYPPELRYGSHRKKQTKRQAGHGKFPREMIPKPHPLLGIPRNYSRYGITPETLLNELKKRPEPDLVFITSMMTYWYPGILDAIHLVKSLMPHVPVVLGGNYVTLCREHASSLGADVIVTGEGEKHLSSCLLYTSDAADE